MSAELEKQLATVQGELDALRAEYTDYAYIVSHDLAAPFRQIGGFASIILSENGDQFDEDTQRHFDRIITGAENGAAIVEALLLYSRVRAEGVQVSTVDCNSVVTDVLLELSESIEAFNAEYSCAKMPTIEGDSEQLRKLFFLLIHNAQLYHTPGSKPIITIDSVESDTQFEFRISDNGIGIPNRQVENVFVALKRAVSNKKYPGMGMGLAIAKCIVQKHRGSIWIQNNEGVGCSVHFTLPKTAANSCRW